MASLLSDSVKFKFDPGRGRPVEHITGEQNETVLIIDIPSVGKKILKFQDLHIYKLLNNINCKKTDTIVLCVSKGFAKEGSITHMQKLEDK